MNEPPIKFRLGHTLWNGACRWCGISEYDLRKWPELQCLPECRPTSRELVERDCDHHQGLITLYEEKVR